MELGRKEAGVSSFTYVEMACYRILDWALVGYEF